MCDVKSDVEALGKFVRKEDGNDLHFDTYSSVFLFTTENQEGINSILDYKNKEILTVASSADQYVSMIYYGAIMCDLYDINKFTYYMSILKIAAIRRLSYDEFISFMVPVIEQMDNSNFFSMKIFKKLVPDLPSDVAYFWENALYLFKRYGYGNFIYLRHKHSFKENVLRGMPFYSNENEYYVLQGMLRKISYPKFYLSDISKMSGMIDRQYDLIYLSNIIECMVYEEVSRYASFYPVNENSIEIDKIYTVCNVIMNMLRKEGDILISYRPNTNLDFCTDVLYQNDYFELHLVDCKIIPEEDSYGRTAKTDVVLTYNPSRKGNFLG